MYSMFIYVPYHNKSNYGPAHVCCHRYTEHDPMGPSFGILGVANGPTIPAHGRGTNCSLAHPLRHELRTRIGITRSNWPHAYGQTTHDMVRGLHASGWAPSTLNSNATDRLPSSHYTEFLRDQMESCRLPRCSQTQHPRQAKSHAWRQ